MTTKCAPATKKPARHFADGGAVSKADQLMAEMAAKYGVTGQAQAAPVQQPAPQPQPKAQPLPQQQGIGAGIIGALKGRAQQIDKAAGYAEGGIIRGPGTAKSDSIPAHVRETGEQIAVSTDERIVSKEQGVFLEGVAKAAGYKNLDAMLEDGTGKPVGPIIRGGKRSAADGLAPDDDPFAYRGGKELGAAGPVNGPDSNALGPSAGITVLPGKTSQPAAVGGVSSDRINTAITAPPTLGVAPLARSEPVGTLTGPASGLTVNPTQKPGRDAAGIITADSAKAAMADPMQRSGGVFGTIDMKGVNEIMARENKARGEMIDSMIAANGGNGVGILPEVAAPSIGGDPLSDGLDMVRRGIGNRTQAGLARDLINAGVAMRGQDQREGLARDGHIGNRPRFPNPLVDELTKEKTVGAQLRNERTGRLNDLQQQLIDETDPEKRSGIAEQIRLIGGKASPRPAGQLSTPQQRTNAEIEASRKAIDGLTPEDIKRRTANFTATGRENPDYDPTLAKAVSQANRRMYGESDDWFDNRQQPKQAAGTDGDVMTRFRSDKAMQGYKLGKQTDRGHEVLDSAGNVIGHWN
jgi:hypothetical protein